MRLLGNEQSFNTLVFGFFFWLIFLDLFVTWTPPWLAGNPTLRSLHGKLSLWQTGLPCPAAWATCLGRSPHLSCKRVQDKIRDFMDGQVTTLGGLPHQPGVPYLHVNRPLDRLKIKSVT